MGRVVRASEAALRLFGADAEALERRLIGGEGPSARRLRRLAQTLPVGAPPRLERMRFSIGRRSIDVNLLCARVAAPGGATYLVLSEPRAGSSAEPAAAEPVAADPRPAPARSRFLWTVDAAGRFSATDAALATVLGRNAPKPGETVDDLWRRAGLERGADLAAALAKRETFSDLTVLWPAVEDDQRIEIRLSGAPVYDRDRGFAGYRGFGVVGETIEDRAEVEPPAIEDAAPEERAPSQGEIPQAKAVSDAASGVEAGPTTSESVPEPPESAALDPAEAPGTSGEAVRDGLSGGQSPAAVASSAPPPPHERTAEIYVLRQTAQSAAPAKIVPIRPGAPAPPPPDVSQGGETVELTKSERDAFREIARALVGRTSSGRPDRPSDAMAAADPEGDSEAAVAPPSPGPPAAAPDGDDPVWRNAAGVLDRLPVGVAVARDGLALYANHTLLALLGYCDFEHFQSADGFAAMFRDHDPDAMSAEGGGSLSIVREDGQPLRVDGHAQAIIWDGAPATLIALRRSEPAVADRRDDAARASLARNGSAAELQEMLDRATDGAVTLDPAGRIVSLNASAERLFGYEQRQVAGESVLMLLAPQSHPETTARLESLSRPDESAPTGALVVVGRRRDGAALTLALTLARVGPPEAFHYCALARDLSQEREAERRLAAARDAALATSAAKTDFLAQVSHEIRTPLHAILGFAEVMTEERFGPIGNERYKDYLKDIHTSGMHVMSLADDLLDLSKIEAGKLDLAFAPVDANSVIRECLSLMQPQAARERIIVRVSLFDHLPLVIADERSLRQILLNLMSNAVKFNEPGGQVIVSTAVDAAGQAVIRVRDTGVGMNEAELGHALEPFGQIGRQGKGGAGLGLPLTKALVEANKAEFSIKSRREHGTLIEIAFPTIQAAQ